MSIFLALEPANLLSGAIYNSRVVLIAFICVLTTPHNSLQYHGDIYDTLVLLQKHVNASSIHVFLRRAMSAKSSSGCPCDLCGVAF